MIKEQGNLTSLKEVPVNPEGFDPKVVKVWYPNFRDHVNPPPSSGKLTPTDAALNPVVSATRPLILMANRSPVPAFSAVAPNAAKRPVPMIMAAVSKVAVVRPNDRRNDDVDSAGGVTERQLAREP